MKKIVNLWFILSRNRAKRSAHLKRELMNVNLLHIILMMLLIELLGLSAHAQEKSQAPLAGKNVLILHALESSAPLGLGTDRGLLDTRVAGVPKVVANEKVTNSWMDSFAV